MTGSWRFLAGCVMAVAATPGCGGDGATGTTPVASVVVTSPVEDVVAAGRSAQLSAVARDASGNTISGKTFTWSSSNASAATVGATGVVQGIASGSATISARTDGVSGSLAMRIVAAELATISTLLGDAYTGRLVSTLTDAPRGRVQTALDACSTALTAGHVLDVRDCLQQIQGESVTDPTDRVLIAVLGIVALRAEQLLNL